MLRLIGRHAGEALCAANGLREFFAMPRSKAGFVIEKVELRRRARLEQVDDATGLDGAQRRKEWGSAGSSGWRCNGAQWCSIECRKGGCADDGRAEELTSRVVG